MEIDNKYKLALERARKYYNNAKEAGDYSAVARYENIFPDLCENEDEKIRKELIGHCKDLIRMVKKDKVMLSVYEPWIAWLEKKKAKERLDRMAPIYNDKESFESALEKAWKYYNESASRTVDSFEDDYIECVFSKGFREGFLYKEKQEEQKLEPCDCSRDEESYINGIHHVLQNPEAYGLTKQKSAEWSEEDEKRIKQLIYDTEAIRAGYEKRKEVLGDRFNNELIKDCDEQINWLKSLRPQPHWKPSEEQMASLSIASTCVYAEADKNALESLYNDLKKLI